MRICGAYCDGFRCYFWHHAPKNNRLIQDLVARMNVLLNETFSGLFVIRSFLMEKVIFAKYVSRNQELYALELRNAKLRGWFYVGSQAAASVTFLISLCLGSYYVSDGILTVGALLTFINLVNHLVYPLTELAGQWAGLQKSVSAMERIFKILEIELESISFPEAIHYKPTLSAIQFKDISFSYDGLKPVLINLICKFLPERSSLLSV